MDEVSLYTSELILCERMSGVNGQERKSLSESFSVCRFSLGPFQTTPLPPFFTSIKPKQFPRKISRPRLKVWDTSEEMKKKRRRNEEEEEENKEKKKKKKDFTTFSEFILTQSIKLFFQKDFHSSENRNLKVRSHNKLHEKKRKNRKRKKNSESVISKSNLFLSLSPPPSLPPSFPLSLFLSLYFSLSCVYSREMYTG